MRRNEWWQALVIFACATTTALLTDTPWSPLQLLLVVPAYLIGRRSTSMQPALLGFGTGLIAQLALSWFAQPADYLSMWLTAVVTDFVILLLPWWLGRALRLRNIRQSQEDAIITDLARMRERARIAEDMHDLIGHDLALISLHSGALELLADASDDQREAASQIRARAVAATDRLHEILGVLRNEETEPRRSPGGLDLDRIVESAENSGMDVNLSVSGPIAAEAVARAVERVVQESLTNAAKHASGAPVTITVDSRAECVDVLVVNERPDSSRAGADGSQPGGMGLIAAEERIRLLGGTMSPRPHLGGFRVSASIPQTPRTGTTEAWTNAGVRGDPETKDRLRSVSRAQRASMRRAALVPGVCAAVLVAVFAVLQALTFASVGLTSTDFARIHVGQPAAEAEAALPDSHVDRAGVPPTNRVPEAPRGASCEYYLAREHAVDFSSDIYRICTRDGVVVAADRLAGKEQ
ncbi:sensor histidine kinase [Brevibacterium aurantiacum]|uniref:histidine kinase n=1 Tax=Brevibacterium aurantiacum TaxID=273384 RepID=A0A2H1IZB6_BREAU|nr:histidine kinase [Brevibacterium aurantiacum]GEB23675.1 two-component sensor histidine kinase [Brevibacterium aurantiacum]SMX80523.1 Signal transduction histidine kinase [Brevibacterium aurantiacum]SMX95639.1 Signal transduction histidine kinase [Brevibacterium aurantiacum]